VYEEVYFMLGNKMRAGYINAIHYVASKTVEGDDIVVAKYDVALKEDPDYIEEDVKIYITMEELWNNLVSEYSGHYAEE
jgi:hypothetical protein